MTTCPSCGSEARAGDWTCGACGTPLGSSTETTGDAEPVYDQSYYQAPTIYGTAPPTIQKLRAGKTSGGSKGTWLGLLAVVAVVAVVAVWFLVLRPAPGRQFLGTWHGTKVTSVGAVPHALTITRKGALYQITDVTGKSSVNRFSAVLRGGRLESAIAATNTTAVGFKTFHLVFAVDHDSLIMDVEGTTLSGARTIVGATERLTRAG